VLLDKLFVQKKAHPVSSFLIKYFWKTRTPAPDLCRHYKEQQVFVVIYIVLLLLFFTFQAATLFGKRQTFHQQSKTLKTRKNILVKKCVVLQVNDAAVKLRLCIVLLFFCLRYSAFIYRLQYRLDGGRGVRRGVPPLWLAVLADGHLVRGPHWFLGGRPHTRNIN
jgi:hypothetical protein